MAIEQVEQESTFKASAQLVDEDGVSLAGSELEALVLEVVESRTGAIARSKRDAYNANDVTIASSGQITWLGQVEDTQILNTDTRLGGLENHDAVFEFAFGTPVDGTGTDLIATTAGDNTVTITLVGHGLNGSDIDEEHCFIVAAEEVGGLNLNGRWRIITVPDGDTFTLEHTCTASATDAGGGGAVSVWLNPRVGIETITFAVRRNRRDC